MKFQKNLFHICFGWNGRKESDQLNICWRLESWYVFWATLVYNSKITIIVRQIGGGFSLYTFYTDWKDYSRIFKRKSGIDMRFMYRGEREIEWMDLMLFIWENKRFLSLFQKIFSIQKEFLWNWKKNSYSIRSLIFFLPLSFLLKQTQGQCRYQFRKVFNSQF